MRDFLKGLSFVCVLLGITAALFFAMLEPINAADDEGATITQSIAESNRVDAQTAVFRADLAAVDTATSAGILATPEFGCAGGLKQPLRPSLVIGARFSDAAQTCKVRYVAVYKDAAGANRIKDLSEEYTLTATGIQDEDDYYMSASEITPAMGGNYGRLILTDAPASGTVSLTLGSY